MIRVSECRFYTIIKLQLELELALFSKFKQFNTITPIKILIQCAIFTSW